MTSLSEALLGGFDGAFGSEHARHRAIGHRAGRKTLCTVNAARGFADHPEPGKGRAVGELERARFGVGKDAARAVVPTRGHRNAVEGTGLADRSDFAARALEVLAESGVATRGDVGVVRVDRRPERLRIRLEVTGEGFERVELVHRAVASVEARKTLGGATEVVEEFERGVVVDDEGHLARGLTNAHARECNRVAAERFGAVTLPGLRVDCNAPDEVFGRKREAEAVETELHGTGARTDHALQSAGRGAFGAGVRRVLEVGHFVLHEFLVARVAARRHDDALTSAEMLDGARLVVAVVACKRRVEEVVGAHDNARHAGFVENQLVELRRRLDGEVRVALERRPEAAQDARTAPFGDETALGRVAAELQKILPLHAVLGHDLLSTSGVARHVEGAFAVGEAARHLGHVVDHGFGGVFDPFGLLAVAADAREVKRAVARRAAEAVELFDEKRLGARAGGHKRGHRAADARTDDDDVVDGVKRGSRAFVCTSGRSEKGAGTGKAEARGGPTEEGSTGGLHGISPKGKTVR